MLANQMSHFLKNKRFCDDTQEKKKQPITGADHTDIGRRSCETTSCTCLEGAEGMNVFHFQNEFMSP